LHCHIPIVLTVRACPLGHIRFRSISRDAAASVLPNLLLPLQTVTVCLYGQTTPRLRQAGMEFAVWMFKHAAAEQLSPAAASILEGCLQLLDEGGGLPPLLPQLLPRALAPSPSVVVSPLLLHPPGGPPVCQDGCFNPGSLAHGTLGLAWVDRIAMALAKHPGVPASLSPERAVVPPRLPPVAASTRAGDAASLTLRGFTYQAVGQLAQRQPQAFAGRTDIAAR
jgi:hypothetical protein